MLLLLSVNSQHSMNASRRRNHCSHQLAWKDYLPYPLSLGCCVALPLAKPQPPYLATALQHVESSETKDRPHVPCIGGRVLTHCATREFPLPLFLVHWP